VSAERYEREFRQVLELFERHGSALVIGHVDPDGDCIGSMLAIGMMLEAMGKTVRCFAPGDRSELFDRMPGAHLLVPIEQVRGFDHDLVVAVDSPTTGRTENLVRPCADEDVVNFDHHPTNEQYGCVNIVDETAAATTMLVYRFMKTVAPERITAEIADCLYLGVLMDTGGFRFQNTDAEALRTAGELVGLGAHAYELAHDFIYMKRFRTLKLLGTVLDSLELHFDGRAATMQITRAMLERTGTEMKDTEGFVDYGAALDDVELIALFRETAPGEIRVSLRSRNDHDVSRLAERFGGGGHVRAAGLTIEGDLETARRLVLDGFAEMIR
jgi:phosphoesterase RecJ-like protein